jgi:hypothetical protein
LRDGRGYELESTIQTGFKIVSLQWDPKGEILTGRLETSKAYFWRFTDRRLSLIKSIVYEGKSADGYWTADGERFIINAGSPTLILDRQIQIVNTLHLKGQERMN